MLHADDGVLGNLQFLIVDLNAPALVVLHSVRDLDGTIAQAGCLPGRGLVQALMMLSFEVCARVYNSQRVSCEGKVKE